MEAVEIRVETREGVGTRRARRLRRLGIIPAIYYRGKDSIPLTIPERSIRSVASQARKGLVLLRLMGGNFGADQYALLKEIQWHPYKNQILHVDLQGVNLDEEIDVYVPLKFGGHPVGVKQGGVLEILAHEIRLRVQVKHIPAAISVDLTPLTLGSVLHVRDLNLPQEVRFIGDPYTPVAHVVLPTRVEEASAEGVESAEGAPTVSQEARSAASVAKETSTKEPPAGKPEKKGKR